MWIQLLAGLRNGWNRLGSAVELSVKINKNRKIMDDYDLVVVLGNVTDNIIEAVTFSSTTTVHIVVICRFLFILKIQLGNALSVPTVP